MGKKKPTKQDVIKVWKELDSKTEKKWVGLNEVCAKLGIKRYHAEQLFQGESLTEVKRRHSIRIAPQEKPYTSDQLLQKYHTVVSKRRRIPSWNQIKFDTGSADSTFKRHFNKTGELKRDLNIAYQRWLKKNKPNSRNLKVVEKWLEGKDKPDVSRAAIIGTSKIKRHVSDKTKGRTYGPPLGYENLVYGPANEQGVVVLFAIISKHLQYYIEGIWGDSFPDCEAIRVEAGGKRRRVRIEFEYMSKDFEGHDPNGCDVLVCWKDNWKNCPPNIEVLELSKVIKELSPIKK